MVSRYWSLLEPLRWSHGATITVPTYPLCLFSPSPLVLVILSCLLSITLTVIISYPRLCSDFIPTRPFMESLSPLPLPIPPPKLLLQTTSRPLIPSSLLSPRLAVALHSKLYFASACHFSSAKSSIDNSISPRPSAQGICNAARDIVAQRHRVISRRARRGECEQAHFVWWIVASPAESLIPTAWSLLFEEIGARGIRSSQERRSRRSLKERPR